ncbi:MAG: ABC transporter ATP-binding protein, partial [Rickettsiales bacterium]|nr:ABC transporter ATP-binding protein [Rickettsiales bacterium]
GLDPITSSKINNLILKTIEMTDATAVTITHDINSARMIADRIVLLDNGKICWEGNRDTIVNSDNILVKNFLGKTE